MKYKNVYFLYFFRHIIDNEHCYNKNVHRNILYSSQIYEVMTKVSSAKAANARNDDKIMQILKLSATA